MNSITLDYRDLSTNVANGDKQDTFFSRILIVLLSIYLIFGIIVPLIEREEITREVKEQIPPQLTRILLQEREKEIIPPKVIEEITEDIIEEPKPQKTKREEAKQKAKSSGLASMKDDLFSLREAFVIKSPQGGLIKKNTVEAQTVKRKLLATKANEQSQNITAVQAGKTVTSDKLSTRNIQTVRLAEEEVAGDSMSVEDIENNKEANLANIRSEMTLRQTLEANKARLYSVYNRALRKNPFLKGKVLFDITIQPNGKVSNVVIQSSELEDKALEKRLTSILKSIDFGVESVDVISTIWAIEFLPR